MAFTVIEFLEDFFDDLNGRAQEREDVATLYLLRRNFHVRFED